MAEVVPKSLVEAQRADALFSRWRREKAARLASQEAGVRSGTAYRGHGWRRTPRDEQLLEFVTLHGMILLRQAAKWFYGGSEQTALKRAVKMTQAGLLARDDGVEEWAGTVLTPTRAGQRVGVSALPRMFDGLTVQDRAVPDNLLHAALVADRMLVARSQGITVLTERQIRLLDKQDDPVEVQAFLESVGVRFAAGATDVGVRSGQVFVKTGEDSAGRELFEKRDTFVAAPVPSTRQRGSDPLSVRYPDFLQVTGQGELVAVEVEIAAKPSDRLGAIIAGYAKAVARYRPDGRGGVVRERKRVRDGEGGTREEMRPVLERHQFRQVQWWCVPESEALLCGRYTRATNGYSRGMITKTMPLEFEGVDWAAPPTGLPMTVRAAVADDSGVQYKLDQRVLYARYRCSYQRWKLWRKVWESRVAPHERGAWTFVKWLMVPAGGAGVLSNLELCEEAELAAANAVPPRKSRVV